MAEIVNSNPLNNPTDKSVRTRSKFSPRQLKLQCDRFGEYKPFLCLDVVPEDKNFMFHSVHDVDSYTLGAPLKQDIRMKKDYFMVDKRAILPFNWEKIYTNPKLGDDIDASRFSTSVADFPSKIQSIVGAIYQAYTSAGTAAEKAAWLCRYWLVAEYFYSNGSLLASLGANLSTLWRVVQVSSGSPVDPNMSFDRVEDIFWETFNLFIVSEVGQGNTISLNYAGQAYNIIPDYDPYSQLPASGYTRPISVRQAIAIMRDSMDFSFTFANVADISTLDLGIVGFAYATPTYPFDIGRCFAYQIVCAHYFTNDNVDFVYNADLFRQLVRLQVMRARGTSTPLSFTLNGLSYEADWTSAEYFNNLVSALASIFGNAARTSAYLTYLRIIFGYNRSLRYMDYFVGGRTRPLAVGDTNVPVVGGNVSVIDVTQKIQIQRALNAVNRLLSRQLPDYVKGIFGVETPRGDFHDPKFLARTEDTIYTTEVENTGSDQLTEKQTVTARFSGQSNRYAFEVDQVDYPSYVIGIRSYDIERAYAHYIERPFFHVNRFDMFNPFMQYIGDQPIFGPEINPREGISQYFGYTLRHMEYKQFFSEAMDGFVEYLPGYAFLGNDMSNVFAFGDYTLTPDYIRSWSFELDPFYVSLTNYSPAGYFHFIVKSVNNCDISRPMAFAPSIL